MVYSARAYAKTNLFLEVLGKREDGYHEIDTVMQSVSVYDEVSVELTTGEITVKCDNDKLSGDDNIAAKACRLFLDYAKIEAGVSVYIKKSIPVAAGMGGGSADAAAVLLLLNIATEKNYPVEELLPIAAKLGADVPFFLFGGCSRARGIGEMLDPLRSCNLYFVFIKEGSKQSTKQMYDKLDSCMINTDTQIDGLISSLKNGNIFEICKYMYNSFELCWNIEEMSAPFLEFAPVKVFLSGSGPTVAAVFASPDDALACTQALKNQGRNAFYAQSVDCGVEIV